MIPEIEADSEVERLSRGFGNLKNIDGKVSASNAKEASDMDSEEEEIIEEEEVGDDEEDL